MGGGQGWELDFLLLPTLIARLLVCIHYTVPKNDPKVEVCVTHEKNHTVMFGHVEGSRIHFSKNLHTHGVQKMDSKKAINEG